MHGTLRAESDGPFPDEEVRHVENLASQIARALRAAVLALDTEAKGTAAFNPKFTYDKISIFPNFGSTGEGKGQDFYVDDLTFIGSVYTPTCP